MPYTLSHIAAALPFGRSGLVLSGVVAGAVAPDVPYFAGSLRAVLDPTHRIGAGVGWEYVHSLAGLPAATGIALVVWMWWWLLLVPPLSWWAPAAWQARLPSARAWVTWGELWWVLRGLPRLRGTAWRYLAVVLGSCALGVVTHVLWDSLTHENRGLVRTNILAHIIVPVLHMSLTSVLQQLSTVVGLAIVGVRITAWWGATDPTGPRTLRQMFSTSTLPVLGAFIAVTLVCFGALLRPLIATQGVASVANVMSSSAVAGTAAMACALTILAASWHVGRSVRRRR